MELEEKDIFEFFSNIAHSFKNRDSKDKKELFLDEGILNNKECFYIFDLKAGEITTYRGFEELLGYTDEDITIDFIYSLHDPEENDILSRITKSAILHCLSNPKACNEAIVQTSFRIRKKDGTYIKVISHSTPFKIDEQGYLTHFLVRLIDVSFLDSSKYVSCFFYAKDLDQKAFHDNIYIAFSDFFTEREEEIIRYIDKRLTNTEIAEELFISKHTVVTHRKNILKKSNQSSTEGLILFCKQRGIL